MRESHDYEAEFESLGESEVTLRLDHHEFQDAQRAYAVRWLNERAMSRNTAAVARADILYESQVELTRKAQRLAQGAAGCAILALGIAVFSTSVAFNALNEVRTLHATPVFAAGAEGGGDHHAKSPAQ
jgi:hypothetical protein